MILFKDKYTFKQRQDEATQILSKYPDKIPIICETYNIDNKYKKKYLVPCELTIGQFMYVLRKKMSILPEQAIFLFINNKLIPINAIIGEIYNVNKDSDGFLYIDISNENTFG